MPELPDIPTLAQLHALDPKQQPGYDDPQEVDHHPFAEEAIHLGLSCPVAAHQAL